MSGHKELLRAYKNFEADVRLPDSPAALYDPINYILSLGGKKLRPVFSLLAFQLGREPDQKALTAAYGIEMFHNFSLVHDDIMDHASLRRGNPTVHMKWDEATGILSGDQMLILAFKAIREASQDLSVLERFEQMSTEVCEGQRMDMDFENGKNISEEDYLEMIRKKTAVLIGFSMWVGAKLSGLSNSICEELYRFGSEIGIGFQIMDDLLDCYGNEKFGKRIGGDILEGKKTLLYLRCFNAASAKDKKRMQELTTGDHSEEEKIEGMLAVYAKYGIRESVEATMHHYFDHSDQIGHGIAAAKEINPEAFERLSTYVSVIRERAV